MKRFLLFLSFFPLFLLHAEPVRIIFDTDITGDVDDVLALSMCHSLADRGACTLLGVTVSKNNPLTASFVDAQNTFHHRPDLPVGVTRDANAQQRESKYLALAESPHYPHDLQNNDDAREAVDLLRELLAKAPDGSVSIISVGIASNMANLLKSKGDVHSPLDGPALIRTKVKLLSLMAGAFAFTNGTNAHLEANVINGIPYMQTLANQWPSEVPIVWSGFEIGASLPFPRKSIIEDLNYLPHHLVKEAYLLHSGPDHDRPCWDESSVLYAVYPDRGYFGLSQGGKVSVDDDGFTRFRPPGKEGKRNKRDRFLTMTAEQQARVLEAIVHLTVQAPAP
ncbi:MAG: nucleoside hydrolase [Verrucomicrobiales bacterium]|nr:nucleoside hydrolase [Verrucomicrobiales bacterium]